MTMNFPPCFSVLVFICRFLSVQPKYPVHMPHNFLVTGRPGSGKTTVVERVVEEVQNHDLRVGGVYSPEIREDGERAGFRIVDAASLEGSVMAHVDYDGPGVGKYGVDVEAVDELCGKAFRRAGERDVVVVDEVAPMEVVSKEFREGVRYALDSETPVLAAVHYSSTRGFVGEVKDRDDAEVHEVTGESRDELPEKLVEMVLEARDPSV